MTTLPGGVFGKDEHELVTSDATGRETGRRSIGHVLLSSSNTLLVLGDLVAQRDFDI